ncbi:hypothetical protein NO1_1069 [Candidatus Termititenax aidoneus]|uniref:Uncharacterized protein n=1 Tax=Termititenax aidoneus TaxID=2218524 RepID=A0A388TAR6_TERA1|nr:hypothetical protein NO1_1069 [Candidatus Termititenax aidoneus]
MSGYNPVSFKYLTGWGDVDLTAQPVTQAATIEDIFKALKKFSAKEKAYFRDKWREAYRFYAGALLEEADVETACGDEYLKKIERELG